MFCHVSPELTPFGLGGKHFPLRRHLADPLSFFFQSRTSVHVNMPTTFGEGEKYVGGFLLL